MNITGTITNASQATEPQGQYSVRYQDVIITDGQGIRHSGRIGSKQGYTINTPIQVTVELKTDNNGNQYNYFKKFNPQHQGQQNQGQQAKPRDFDQENHGKCFTVLMGALIQSGREPQAIVSNRPEVEAIANLATICMHSYDYRTQSDPYARQDQPQTIGNGLSQEEELPF